MASYKNLFITIVFVLFTDALLTAQEGAEQLHGRQQNLNSYISLCDSLSAGIYEGINDDIRGYSIALTTDRDGLFVGGFKNDSVLIVRMDLEGKVGWARTFSVIPGREHNISTLLVDAEGMVAITGIAGNPTSNATTFAMRYNPLTNQILWAREYRSGETTYNFSMIEIPNGNYIISNNPHYASQSNDLAELIEIDKTNGNIISTLSTNYDLSSAEQLVDIVYHEDAIYGVGRYTVNPSPFGMRHTLVKINPANGTHIWAKMGHVPQQQAARLYGFDLVIYMNEIYSGYFGDSAGSSLTNRKLYLQKSSLDGDLVWLKQYDLPGGNDEAFEIIASVGGVLILAGDQNVNQTVLFKIDSNGNVLWGRDYNFPGNGASVYGRASSQLIETGNQIIFTGYNRSNSTISDLFVVITNEFGETNNPCIESASVSINVLNVINPVFFSVDPDDINYNPQIVNRSATGKASTITARTECSVPDPPQFIEHTICEGQTFQGYSISGIFTDTLITSMGCDSIRILQLDVISEIFKTDSVSICLGDSYMGYTTAGIYLDTFQASGGCDSIVRTILDLRLHDELEEVEICSGQSFENYSTSGFYIDTIPGLNSECDTIRHLFVTVLPAKQSHIFQTICNGENYSGYTTAGIYTDSLITNEGCDSIRTVTIELIDIAPTVMQGSLCDAIDHGHSAPGTYTDSLISIDGCDSVRTITLSSGVFYIPNIFSPNNDGQNDFFEIQSSENYQLSLEYFAIFDRMGNMVYQTNSFPVRWDGKDNKGRFFNPAVFTYTLLHHCGDDRMKQTGDITLVR